MPLAYLGYRRLARKPFVRHQPRLMLGAGDASPCLPSRSLVFPGAGFLGDFGDFDQPLLYGLFASEVHLHDTMKAEGGNTDLVIVDQNEAQRVFTHARGARFSPGLYVPHPKDPGRLVPLVDYPARMLDDVHAEWVSTFEALGASRVVISDVSEHKVTGHATAPIHGIPTTVELQAAYGVAKVQESTFGPSPPDERRAVQGLWYGDHPPIRAIVEGRIRGRQLSWRKSVHVDASFGVDVSVLKRLGALGGGVGYQHRRAYDVIVEFHPVPA